MDNGIIDTFSDRHFIHTVNNFSYMMFTENLNF